jgi:hypothetical protein
VVGSKGGANSGSLAWLSHMNLSTSHPRATAIVVGALRCFVEEAQELRLSVSQW